MKLLVACCLVISFGVAEAHACTTYCMALGGRVLFGANYDWDTGVGMVTINKRSVAKESFTGRPVRWVSRFASITFNQYGRDFPTGGMNEAGLVVALMALDQTRYPAVDSRPSVGILEWIQYQLDGSADVDEVLRRSAEIRIAAGKGLHYLVSDRSGRSTTIEYLNGALVAHVDASLPVAVLTNNTYEQSMSYLRTISGFGGTRPVPTGIGSLERFARAAFLIRQTSTPSVERAFQILDAVHQPDYTKWSIVYDPMAATVYYRTDTNAGVRWISFAAVDASCSSPVKVMDVNAGGSDDVVSSFTDYSLEANLALVNTAYDQTPFLRDASEEDRRGTALHPEGDVCVDARRSRAVRH